MAGKLINWVGRPLLASEAQTKEALRCHKRGISLREIAKGLSLSLRTVRTIVAKAEGTDPASHRHGLLRKREFDRLRAAEYRRRKKAADALPKQVTKLRKQGDALIKKTKGLGRSL